MTKQEMEHFKKTGLSPNPVVTVITIHDKFIGQKVVELYSEITGRTDFQPIPSSDWKNLLAAHKNGVCIYLLFKSNNEKQKFLRKAKSEVGSLDIME